MTPWGYGSRVEIRNGRGQTLTRRALTGVMMGEDFPVVWACREDEWDVALRDGRPPEGVPWPAEDVRLLGEADQ